ncbi:YD repeat-containing protein [Cyclobacterium xiamenense]|uniref:YD repeat-containing protein n=1 Tax=Cyclobacterium xiamenense TaxID=1297121 RepID=A0A1H7CC08_9BACT|nr:hypothetical protein [Cyclobacterium xiamenense]SEJ83195.1 YD repeat-containing protein [Cyclobacterium xiamenense]
MKTVYKCNQRGWRRFSLSLLFGTLYAFTSAQDMTFRAQVIPPSPEVSALAKFADTRVSHYSGIPDIQLPLYTLVEQDLELPIALQYHAGGIRVEERAGWAGLGWALNAGGSISRTIKGLPDEQTGSGSGYTNHEVAFDRLSTAERMDYYQRSQNGTIDFEQDIFHFVFGNYSGKFVLGKDGTVSIMSASYLKIQFEQVNRDIVRWNVWDGNGNRYIFEDPERTITEDFSKHRTVPYRSNYYSAWHLSKIITYNGREIRFSYAPYTASYYTRSSQSASYFLTGTTGEYICGNDRITDAFTEVTVRGKQLQSIRFGLGEVLIESKNDRKDASSNRLAGIKVINNRGRLIKSFVFDHDYYQSNLSSKYTHLPEAIKKATPTKRLRLVQVTENTTNPSLDYRFEYHGNVLPHFFSNSQDHWGFYNGAINESLIPQYMRFRKANANRLVVPEYALTGTLKKVSYPTGGSVSYEMESNTALVRSGEYYNFFSPVTLEADQPTYAVSVNSQRRKAFFQVEPKESDLDTLKLIRFSVQLSGRVDCDGRDRDCRGSVDVYLYSPADRSFISLLSNTIQDGAVSGNVWLKAGTRYELHLDGPSRLAAGLSATVFGRRNPPKQEETGRIEVSTGGLRVKSITKDFGNQTETVEYHYEQPETNQSSGSLATFPKYDFIIFNTFERRVPTRNDIILEACLKFELRSYSQVPLSVNADFFGYANVKEIRKNKAGEILRTDYRYLSPADFPDQSSYSSPFGIVRSAAAKRGVPKAEVYYVQTGDSFQKSLEKVYTYQPSERVSHENFKFFCMGYGPGGCRDVRYLKYFNTTVWNPRVEIKEIRYDSQTGASFEKTSILTYDENYLLPTKTTRLIATNNSIEEEYYYPFNLPASLNASRDPSVLTDLIEANRIVPTLAQRKKAGGQLLEQEQVQLQRYHGRLLPAALLKKHADQSEYEDLRVLSYDRFGNILEQKPRTGPRQSFLWFEQGNWMAAAVHNAAAEEIAYTSFETEDMGGWIFSGDPQATEHAKTGQKQYHLGSGPISKTGIPASKNRIFLLSFWAKKASKSTSGSWSFMGKTEVLTDDWQLIQREITTSRIAITGQGVLVDEVRLHPKDAFMETFTHEPLLGMSSSTDQRHYTHYYDYDGMGRLATIRNADRDVLEHYLYTFQTQKQAKP